MISKLPLNQLVGISLSTGLLFMASCTKVDADNGPKIANRVETLDFDKIVLHTGGQLNYKQDNFTQITVNTTQDVFNALELVVKDKTLHIKRKNGFNILNQDDIVFDITDDDTYSIEICGSGDVNADFDENYHFSEHYLLISGSGDIIADEVNAVKHRSKISGSGHISVGKVISNNAEASISGSGDIAFLSGAVGNSNIDIRGSGSFEGFDFFTEVTDIKSSGSGTVYVRAESQLNAKLSGSGSVYYKGQPNLVYSVSGSGNIHDSN